MPASLSLVLLALTIFFNQVLGAECPAQAVVSCQAPASQIPSCCVARPAGLFSYTQTYDATQGRWLAGHLRLINCDGSEYHCQRLASRSFTPEAIAVSLGQAADHTDDGQLRIPLPRHQNVYQYIAQQWSDAGICISTLAQDCTTSDKHFGIRLFYRALDALSSRMDTQRLLAAKRIYPSASKKYPRDRLLDALHSSGKTHPYIECDGDVLRHVEYRFVARGPFQDLDFESPATAWSVQQAQSSCPISGVRYLSGSGLPDEGTNHFAAKEPKPDKKPLDIKKLKFFKDRHGQRMPDESIWKPEPEEAPKAAKAHDEL